MAQLIQSGEFVGPGEERTARYLEAELPRSWTVICNKELVNRDGSTREADFIVVGSHSVFVIEEKSWRGPIHGNENGWVLTSGESFPSPVATVEGLARRLAGMLRGAVPMLRERLGAAHFVFGRVVLSSQESKIFVHDPRVGESVLHLDGCEQELIRHDKLQDGIGSISSFRLPILERLTGLPNRPKIPQRVGDYAVLEVIPAGGATRALRARHADGTERILKLVQRPSTLDPALRKAREAAVLREYESLKRLVETGHVPAVDPYFSWDQNHYWVIPVHPPKGRSLRADRADAPPTAGRILKILGDAFQALAEIHSVGVVHRALTPDRVIIGQGGGITFTDFQIARIEGEITVGPYAEELDPGNPYAAPECLVDAQLATFTSDVYGLAASLLYWITGHESDGTPIPPVASLRSDLPIELQETLSRALDPALREDERARPSAIDVAKLLTAQVEETPASRGVQRNQGLLNEGDILENQYRIVRVLGHGGTATTYLAHDLVADRQFVLKTIRNPELIARLSSTEFRLLDDLSHRSLPRVYDVRSADKPFHLKLEYVRGATLRELQNDHLGAADFCRHIGFEILGALAYLEERGLIHRDVSPNNIMVPDEEAGAVKLIDFGLATAEKGTDSAVGTPRYRAPEIDRRGRWTNGCDLYSLGVVLHELLTGRLPYEIDPERSRKERLVTHTTEEEQRFGKRLLRVLLKASAPSPADRFQQAREFMEALRNSAAEEVAEAEGEERINPFVSALRGVYRNSRLGNADNRGLDSEFAISTYVETKLDTELLPELIAGRYRLVVLSGNPGDGKTAFLQRFRERLAALGATVQRADATGWRLRFQSRTYAALYDASESHDSRSADDLAHDILRPLAGNRPMLGEFTAVVAANDGRLLDFFERYGTDQYGWLWPRIQPQLLEGGRDTDGILLVDLKQRSLAAHEVGEHTIFSRILDEFVGAIRWAVCDRCISRNECPMRANALTFRDQGVNLGVRQRLRDLLLAVHLRRERRPTIRDLRSALAYLITNDLSCEEVHAERRGGTVPLASADRLYFSAAFSGAGSPDLLLDEWAQLDPANVSSPVLDRFLYFHRERSHSGAILSVLEQSVQRPPLPLSIDVDRPSDWLQTTKRRYFFESKRVPQETTRSDLPEASSLLPYRHFHAFVQALLSDANEREIRTQLLKGISIADGVPERAARESLALRLSERSDEEVTVIKRFNRDDFRLMGTKDARPFVESVPDTMRLTYGSGSPSLIITLDLFEMLMRAADGYLPGALEQGALMEEIAVFKNQLLARPTRDVVIVEGGGRFHRVSVENGRITRSEVAT